jgi:hypothetical protein
MAFNRGPGRSVRKQNSTKKETEMTVLNKTIKAAAVALALAGTAMPASAASFGLSFGNDNFRFGVNSGDRFDHFPGNDRLCMSDREVRRDLRSDGYREIRFTDRQGRIVHLVAELQRPGRDRDYAIAYDTCRGRIVDRDRIG